jgi:uncharacterized protein
MTPQEAQMLQDLVKKVAGTPLTEKDPDAAALLNDGLGRDPDALYKLAQTVLIQDMTIHQLQARIQQLSANPQPAQQPARASSFLGGLLHRNPPAAPPPPQQYQPVASAQPQYQPVQAPPPQPYYQEAPPPTSGGGSGFLRSAATTAAGVAAGALAFEGIESLMHGGFGHGGFGEPGYMGYGGAPVEETIVNNYYDDPAQNAGGGDIAGPDMQPQGPYDDASYDASDDQDSFDDQGSFDDGGGFDDGGNDLI